jgi:hypothetical protein
MNVLGALVLVAGGLSCIVWSRKLSDGLSKVYSREFRRQFGQYATERGWDDATRPFNKFLYRGMVVLFGLFLLIVAFHVYVGTVYFQ